MPAMPPELDLLRTLSAHAVPALFVLGAFAAGRDDVPAPTAWRRTQRCAALAALTSVATFGVALAGDEPWAAARSLVLVLIGGLGLVLARFSATYLAGEPGQPRFVRWFLATLAGSSLVVASEHLGILAAAWFATSLALQNLLLFYGDRPAAQMAAHKKFLVSRTADLCLATAAIVLALHHGTLDIDALCAAALAPEPGAAVQAAAILVAVAALLKTAQLPFHGWLMQVMEAPTPVSALLHAGVVNLGGFVLIRLQPLIAATPAAQGMLVVVGSLTAALAGLVATTRVSVKVALAWSTCAQMGFMVLQCGLGLPEMALLHLLAHSLYKANAFLGAGTTVHHAVIKAMTPAARVATVTARLVAAGVAAALVVGAASSWSVSPAAQPGLAAMAFVVALALVPLLATGELPRTAGGVLLRMAPPVGVALVWFGLHRGLHAWLGEAAPPSPVAGLLAVVAVTCFALLFAAQTLVAVRPDHALSRRLHPWCFGGLYLDEWFTRLTLRVWPIRRPDARAAVAPDRLPEMP